MNSKSQFLLSMTEAASISLAAILPVEPYHGYMLNFHYAFCSVKMLKIAWGTPLLTLQTQGGKYNKNTKVITLGVPRTPELPTPKDTKQEHPSCNRPAHPRSLLNFQEFCKPALICWCLKLATRRVFTPQSSAATTNQHIPTHIHAPCCSSIMWQHQRQLQWRNCYIDASNLVTGKWHAHR